MCAKQPITCVIFGLLFLSAGCRNAENNLYRIPLKEALSGNVHRFSAGEVIDSVRYIPLETTDSCFIGDLYKILCWKESGLQPSAGCSIYEIIYCPEV